MEITPFFVVLLMACLGQLKADLICPDVTDGEEVFLPSDTNCGEYFHCVNGVPVEMKCPDGLWWDQSNGFCNWPDQVSPPCTANCPAEGWIRKDKVSNCYLFGTEAVSFDEAQRFCRENGGMLAEPRSNKQNRTINKMINNNRDDTNYWIGLTDDRREGTFVWKSDNTEVSFSNWNKNEPNNMKDQEDCVVLRKTRSFEWNDVRCFNDGDAGAKTRALCQKY